MDNFTKPKLVQPKKRSADHARGPVSIALFHFSANKNHELNHINKLLELIQNSTRETDIVGFINHDAIGLILPDTNEQGMQECMKKIISGYTHLPFSIVTGTYPGQIIDNLVSENRESPEFYPLFLEDSINPRSLDHLGSVWNPWRALKPLARGSGSHPSAPRDPKRPLNDVIRSLKTDILPKSYFLKQLQREKRRADRTRAPLSIALFRFIAVKGDHSDKVGKFLELLQSSTRETDIVGYLGEDLISLLLPETNKEGAQECINKIAKGYKKLPFSIITGTYPDQIFDNLVMESEDPTDFYPLLLEDSMQSKRLGYLLKRLLDIVGSLIGILLFSPVMLITAIAIKITSPGPVIFKQIRLGQRGVPFIFYKFRSMFTNTDDRIHREYVTHLIKGHLEEINQGDQEQPLYKIKSDPRVTRVGRIIRKTSIDELPQFFNVLKGEMSLVGPRPPLPYEVEKYQSWHLRRIFETKPGITGLWQVEGRSQTSFDDMVRLDLRYIRKWSLWLDFKILLKTIRVVLKSAGAV